MAGTHVLISPSSKRADKLHQVYQRAFNEAQEVYIASAYLTEWNSALKVGPKCERISVLVGTDFGVTRKHAMRSLLEWRPRQAACRLQAVDSYRQGGFHPKVMIWKTPSQKCHCLIGSSNLSKAAFSKNYEGNVAFSISLAEYDRIRKWLESALQYSREINYDYITLDYDEADPTRNKGKGRGVGAVPARINRPDSAACRLEVRDRRRKQNLFEREIAKRLRNLIMQCSRGKISNDDFWERMKVLWWRSEGKFQGSGIQYSGKGANWQSSCTAVAQVFAANALNRDQTVSKEMNRLASERNPTRGAWLSEMLCHYFPSLYPISNGPVKRFMTVNKWRPRRTSTEGERYISLAKQLRELLFEKPAGARDLAELDGAIWVWMDENGFLPKSKTVSN